MEDREYTVVPTKIQTTAVKVEAPKRNADSAALTRMRKWKRVIVFLKAQRDVAKNGSGLAQWTSADESKLKRANDRFEKARKMAAPELIRLNRAKRASWGRGRKRGSYLSKLK